MLCSSRPAAGGASLAMDKLRSEQEQLCVCLSSDPDYILEQCGDILTVNECKEVQKQTGALEKTRKLVKIIIHKGGETCQSFLDILQQNKGRYRDLQQFFNPTTHGSPTPTMFADGNSVVMNRTLTNITANSLSMNVEIESQPAGNPPRNAVPQANYTASDSSAILADTLTDINIKGDIVLSASIGPSQPNPGTANDSGASQMRKQGPAEKWIIEHKVELIACLRADLFILQHVHERQIVTDSQYESLKHSSPPEKTVTNLIDLVMGKGQETCDKFLQVLKEPNVLQTYPQLENMLKSAA